MGKQKVNKLSSSREPAVKFPTWYLSQCQVKQQLTHNFDSSHFIKKAHDQLTAMLQRTVEVGESNSMLIIGPRASGKSTLVNKAIDQLYELNMSNTFSVIRLNGLTQNTDRTSLREIANQLRITAEFDEVNATSMVDTLNKVLDTFRGGSEKSRVLIFVLDEFDQFAERKNQMLLYNLFDISQSKQIPIGVIGLTSRLDVTELLEKRVKSRYSFRQIHLHMDVTFTQYKDTFVSLLSLDQESLPDKEFGNKWNENVLQLSTNPTLDGILYDNYVKCKSIHFLQTFLTYPIGCVNASSQRLKLADFIESQKLMTVDDRSRVFMGLSVLELCLMVAVKHLSELKRNEPFNMKMVQNHYQKFVGRVSSTHSYSRAVVTKAFEHLEALELIQALDGKGTNEYRLYRLLIEPCVIDKAVEAYPGLPYDLVHWAMSKALT